MELLDGDKDEKKDEILGTLPKNIDHRPEACVQNGGHFNRGFQRYCKDFHRHQNMVWKRRKDKGTAGAKVKVRRRGMRE